MPAGIEEVLLGVIVGAVLSAPAVVAWTVANGRRLGKLVGSRIPGDTVERWLIEFLTAFADGLKTTISIRAKEGVITLEVPTNPKSDSLRLSK